MPYLTRQDLHRVLQKLMETELNRTRRGGLSPQASGSGLWPETLVVGEGGSSALACDSIERLWLAGAVNEMFCLSDSRTENGLLSAGSFGAWLGIVDRGWNECGRRITFATSGSTGVPGRCTHAMADLQGEVAYLAERFTGTRRVIALAPPHHIYGFLFTALLPSHMHIPVIAAEGLAPGKLIGELCEGDLLIATPPRWDWLLQSVRSWPHGVRGVCSTANFADHSKQQLMCDGLQGFTEVYGSTETAGVGLRTYPAERYALMPFWTWAARDATAPSVRDGTGKTVALPDELDISADGSFLVKKRRDGAVQIGGVNVFPAHIEELLRALPGVAEASVRLSEESSPQRLKAFVVAESSVVESQLAETLETWASGFSAPERVCSFTFGATLPRNEAGKASDWTTSADAPRPYRA